MPRANLILFTPGPVRIPPSVAEYAVDPPCNYHRQPGFCDMFEETEADLKYLIGLKDPSAYQAVILGTTGTGANEACMQALEGFGKGLILRNGFFGARLVDQCVQDAIPHMVLDAPDDRPFDPHLVETTLKANPDLKWVYFVSHETRAGLANPVLEIGQVCTALGVKVGADLVSSAWAYPVPIEAAGLDFSSTSSSKAIMALPGLGIVFAKRSTLGALKERQWKGRSYYLDLVTEAEKQRKDKASRFGQPIAQHAALRAACAHVKGIGIENHMRRIKRQMREICSHLESLGCPAELNPAHRSWVAMNFRLPADLTYDEFTRMMCAEGYYLLWGSPTDPSVFQVSTMGDISDEHVAGLKRALSKVLAGRQRAVA